MIPGKLTQMCMVCRRSLPEDAPDRIAVQVDVPIPKTPKTPQMILFAHKGCLPARIFEGDTPPLSVRYKPTKQTLGTPHLIKMLDEANFEAVK